MAVATFDAKVQQIIEQTLHCPIAGKLQRRFQTGAFVHRTGGGGGGTDTHREREKGQCHRKQKNSLTQVPCVTYLVPFLDTFVLT